MSESRFENGGEEPFKPPVVDFRGGLGNLVFDYLPNIGVILLGLIPR